VTDSPSGDDPDDPGDHPADRSERTCARTGLRLVRADGQVTYRVANNSYGPMAPKPRNLTYGDVEEWARWDSAGGRTIYSADTPTFAYLEVLAYVTPSESLNQMPLSTAFPDSDEPEDQAAHEGSGESEATMLERIGQEWQDQFGQFGIGKNTKRWREVRSLFPITLPTSGWFIDISHSDTVSALNRSGPPLDGPSTRPSASPWPTFSTRTVPGPAGWPPRCAKRSWMTGATPTASTTAPSTVSRAAAGRTGCAGSTTASHHRQSPWRRELV